MSTISVQIDPDLDTFAETFINWFAEREHLNKPRVKIWIIPALAEWEKLFVFPIIPRNPVEHNTATPHNQVDGFLMSRKSAVKIRDGLTPAQLEQAKKEIEAVMETVDAFMAGQDYAIFLNRQFLQQQSKFEKISSEAKIKYVLTHELIHAFEHESNTTIITQNDDEKVNDALERFTTANPKWAY